MNIQPRPYAGLDDLEKMKSVVLEGRKVSPHSGYPHIGDLNWWLFYGAQVRGRNLADIITLWEDEEGRTVGWVFAEDCQFDMAVLPEFRGSPVEAHITAWGIENLTPFARTENKPIEIFACADETARQTMLNDMGCVYAKDYLVYFSQSLTKVLPEPALPAGFAFFDTMPVKDADQRADVHFNAFRPSRMTAAAYSHFMTAPDYDPTLDVVVLAPDGTFAAFAMGWLDPVNKIGVFEPVGTRDTRRRLGLGRAALLEGMHRMQARGMETATVCAHAHNEGNLAFYRSAGFHPTNRILVYSKAV
jgi:ribosomal protein S18 acetylase RimI-like enzyme